MAHIPGPGDVLASGAKSATYRMPGSYTDPQIAEDLANMSEGEFRSLYLVSIEEYERLKAGGDSSSLVRFNKTVAAEESADEVKVVDNRPDFELLEKQREAELEARKAAILDELKRAMVVTAKPFGKKVMLWRIPLPENFIQLADTEQEKPVECIVVAVSDGIDRVFDPKLAPHEQKTVLIPGDKVLVRKFAGTEVLVDGISFAVVYQDDILLKF